MVKKKSLEETLGEKEIGQGLNSILERDFSKDESGVITARSVLKALGVLGAGIAVYIGGNVGPKIIGGDHSDHGDQNHQPPIEKVIKSTIYHPGDNITKDGTNLTIGDDGGLSGVGLPNDASFILPNPETGYIAFNPNGSDIAKEAANIILGNSNNSAILENLSLENISKINVIVSYYRSDISSDPKNASAAGIARIYAGNNTTFTINLTADQVIELLNLYDNGKKDNDFAWKLSVQGIGPKNMSAYMDTLKTVESLTGEDHFGKATSELLEKLNSYYGASIEALQENAKNLTEQISNLTNQNSNLTKQVWANYIAGQKLILAKFACDVATITGNATVANLVNNATTNESINDTYSKICAILTNYTNDLQNASAEAKEKAKQEVLNVWRTNLWNNYSYWLSTLNVSQDDLNNTDANGLWNYTKAVTDALCRYDGTADSIIIHYGNNGTALNDVLNKLANAGRFNMRFDYTQEGQSLLTNLTNYLESKNLSLPWNISELQENGYGIRVTDTISNGSIGVIYDRNGNVLTTKTRILNHDVTNAIKEWAYEKGLSGVNYDE